MAASRGSILPPAAFVLCLVLLLPLLASSQPGNSPDADAGPGNSPDADAGPDGPDAGGAGGAGGKPAQPAGVPGALKMGFYEKTCPRAEQIVKEVLLPKFNADPGIAAGLIRLFFHDCFVQGCDASILLDETPTNEDVEKVSTHNGQGVKGYTEIDDIKAKLEEACPGVVSCADILAFAARESLVFTGVPNYNVEGGRRDSRISLASNVPANLPVPATPVQEIVKMFTNKGLTVEDIITLIGTHSIGGAHCTTVADRIRDRQKSRTMDQGFVTKMKGMTLCMDPGQTLPFDPYTPNRMDFYFYAEVLKNRILLESDENLAKLPEAKALMQKYVTDPKGWREKLADAMIRMGKIEVLTGTQGEVRKKCMNFN